jgi:uncharacterized membrane protein
MLARARIHGDEGSLIPMILMAFVVAGLIIVGSVVAGAAFLAQRDLQSVCDGAAIAGAQSLDDPDFYHNGVGSDQALPLGGVQQAVDKYAAEDGSHVRMIASVGDDHVTVAVACNKTAHLTFGAVFGYGNGLKQHASAHARSRTAAALTGD